MDPVTPVTIHFDFTVNVASIIWILLTFIRTRR